MKKMYIVYIIAVVALCVLGILIARGNLWWFYDPPSLMLTLGIVLLLLLGHFSPKEMIEAFRCAGAAAERSDAELKKALLFFETFHRLTIISGFMSFMLGLILFLAGMDLSDEKAAGPFMAVAVMTVLYALIIIMMITVPFQSAIKKKMIG
jgi:flagellar motor component MotA